MTAAEEVVRRFVQQINTHNVDGLCNLMSDDHKFIEPLGGVVQGRDAMRGAWGMYFRMVPDYHISCNKMIGQDNAGAAFGMAGGTYSPDGGELVACLR